MIRLTRKQKYAAAGGSLFMFSFIFRFIILPPITKMQVKDQVQLKPSKYMRGIWSAYPFPFGFNIYMFNITNPDEVMQGEKPILQEVGPFVYDVWREKTNLMDRNEDDTVSYTNKATYYFNAKQSNGLSDEEELVVPHYFILGMINVVKLTKPSALPVIGKGVDSIFQRPTSLFMRAKVKDILFDGFPINCTVKDFAGSAVCAEIKRQYENFGMKLIGEDQYRMSLFGTVNGTSSKNTIRVMRGSKKLMKLGQVTEFNDKPSIGIWNDTRCDYLNGTDSTIYHPFLKKNEYIGIFVEAACKIYYFEYFRDGSYAGLKTYGYTTNLGVDAENNPDDKCYCADLNNCMKKGVLDVFKCRGLPIFISNPHFYLADPYYLNLVDGLNPDKEKHMLFVDLQPMTGVPMHAHTRVQVNMPLFKADKFKLMKSTPEALLPLFWMDDILNLPDFLVKPIKDGMRTVMLAKIAFFLMTLGGMGMSAYSGYLYYKAAHRRRSTIVKNLGDKGGPVNLMHTAQEQVNDQVDKSIQRNPNNAKIQAARVPVNIG